MQFGVYGRHNHANIRVSFVLEPDEYEYLYHDREWGEVRLIEIQRDGKEGLRFQPAASEASEGGGASGGWVWRLQRVGRDPRRLSVQVSPQVLGITLPVGVKGEVPTRRVVLHGRPALWVADLTGRQRPRGPLLALDLVKAQRLLNQMVARGEGRLEVGEDGRLKVYPAYLKPELGKWE